MKTIITRVKDEKFISISDWEPEPQDLLIMQIKDYLIIPVAKYFNADSTMDYFSLRAKNSYNKLETRSVIVQKLNYFEKFYDKEKELLSIYANLKYMIDCEPNYTKDAFFYDLKKYIIHGPSLSLKMDYMNKDNFVPTKNKFSGKDKLLYYDNDHVIIMLRISLTMCTVIPLLTHFANKHKIKNIKSFLLEIYTYIIKSYDTFVDLFAKFEETCSTKIRSNKNVNKIWKNQDIRAINETSHTVYAVDNIVINIMPKYIYSDSPVKLNYASVGNTIKYKVTDAGYDFAYSSLSSSERDSDENSAFDRYEAILAKVDRLGPFILVTM